MHSNITQILCKLHYPAAKHKRVLVLVSIYCIDSREETEEKDRRIKEIGAAGQDATGGKVRSSQRELNRP
jgi:hypothetical protein